MCESRRNTDDKDGVGARAARTGNGVDVAINFQEYFGLVIKSFEKAKIFDQEGVTVMQEDIFRLRWLSRVRFNSFVTNTDEIDARTLSDFTTICLGLARKARSKLGELIVVNGVVCADRVGEDAKAFALQRPKKRMTSDVYPILVDLSSGEMHYYTGSIIYGILYEKFEREYIDKHFSEPLRFLNPE
jgi:hypothetical protein